jgi:hypothetical protein
LAVGVGIYLICRRDSGQVKDESWMSLEEAFSEIHIN